MKKLLFLGFVLLTFSSQDILAQEVEETDQNQNFTENIELIEEKDNLYLEREFLDRSLELQTKNEERLAKQIDLINKTVIFAGAFFGLFFAFFGWKTNRDIDRIIKKKVEEITDESFNDQKKEIRSFIN